MWWVKLREIDSRIESLEKRQKESHVNNKLLTSIIESHERRIKKLEETIRKISN